MRVDDLRKPTVAAAIANGLARKERMNVRALLAAGERLRDAQANLLGGGRPDAVHKAADDERKALRSLLAAARRDGAGDAALRKVEETLRAAAVDDEARALLQAGRLTRELEPVGFGLAGMPTPRPARKKRPRRPDPAAQKRQKDLARARSRLEDAERRAADAARAVADAEEQMRSLERSHE